MTALRKTLVLALFCSTGVFAQSIISAKAGVIHYTEGAVLLDSKPLVMEFGVFPDIKVNGELRTEAGRAEVLLTPGVFLRLGENTSIKMLSNFLSDTKVELLSGSAVLESDWEQVVEDDTVTILYKGVPTRIRKGGIYRFDTDPASLRVYSGEAQVKGITVKGSRMLALDSAYAAEKFDNKETDALTRWSRRRAEYIAMASVSAAKSLQNRGDSWLGGWHYNPYFGLITYLPGGGGYYRTPYGYMIYAPRAVYRVYEPPVMMAPATNAAAGFGASPSYRSVQQTSSGYSGVVASAPTSSRSAGPAPTAAPAAAPVARESGRVGGTR